MPERLSLVSFEALVALQEHGTMLRAAARLGVSQPTISKRIQQLENELGQKLIEQSGRKVLLTPQATAILERAKPLYREFKEALREEASEGTGELAIALSGALLLSWGAKVLRNIRRENPGIGLRFAVHRSPIAVARVRAGDSMLALVHGKGDQTPDLIARQISEEEFVIVPSELKPFTLPRRGKTLELLTIESHSDTWSVLERKLRRWAQGAGVKLEVDTAMQNFLAVTQLAQAGFGHGLVPLGVPRALGIPEQKLVRFPKPGIQVAVSVLGRRSTLERQIAVQFIESLERQLARAT